MSIYEIDSIEVESVSGGSGFSDVFNPTHTQDPAEIARLWEEYKRLYGN